MTDEIMHTVVPSGNGWGGALGAGVGGLIGSWLGGNGFGGFGYNRGAGAAVGYDTGVLNGLQSQINGLSSQINSADRDFLMQTSAQNQFLGNMINSTGDAVVAGITQNTISNIQSANATNMAMAQGFGGINSALNSGFGTLNLTVAEQNAQNRLQAQELAAQQQSCCCQVLRAIETEGCQNRELQREIQTQNIRDQLANSQAENQALKAQLFSVNAMNAQTAAIINALKPTTTTAGA